MPTVILYWAQGRSPEQKDAVIKGITETLVEHAGARAEDVLVVFQDIMPGDFGRGGVRGASTVQAAEAAIKPPASANGHSGDSS